MRVGYAMIYPYRGSIHNMIYLSRLMESAGCESYYLTCQASVPYCYNRLLKGTSKAVECAKCMVGNCRSFGVKNVTSMDSKIKAGLPEDKLKRMVESTSYSLHRIETDEDCQDEEVLNTQKKLALSANIVYQNALKWIEDNKIELMFIYNGRLDLPRAVLEACKDKNIPFFTFEAAYPGISIKINEDCRGLVSLNGMVEDFIESPLTRDQSSYAAKLAIKMLTKKNMAWRLYNTQPAAIKWPLSTSGNRVLIVPSSNHECKGLDDWTPEWKSAGDAIDAILEKLNIGYDQCVIRFHPNWAENIGINPSGEKSERYYSEWARKRGVHVIPSHDKANTNDLIRESDIVIVQGGTAGIEAGLLGKKVIGIIPSTYSKAGFSVQVHGINDLHKLMELDHHDAAETIRKTLRFLYIYHKRFPQYTEYVKPVNVHENIYFDGATADKIFKALEKGRIQPDDPRIGDNSDDENEILDLLIGGKWEEIMDEPDQEQQGAPYKIKRKFGFNWIDGFRAKFKSGDR